MTSMRVSATPLIASSLIVGDTGLGVEGIDIPGTGEDGPSVLFQYVTLPADNDNEFRMLVTSQPSVGTLTTFEDGSFIYAAPDLTVDSFNYEWFKNGVSQASDTVNLTIGIVAGPDVTITESFSGFSEDIRVNTFLPGTITSDITETFGGFSEIINIRSPFSWTDKPPAVTNWTDKPEA